MSLSITGKRWVKMSPWSIWLLLDIYMCPCMMSKGKFSSSEWILVDWNRYIWFRIWFCIWWCYFERRENVRWNCHLDRFDYCWTYICVHVRYRKGNPALQNEFPSFVIGLFDSEFDSASNDVTFNHGKTIGENVTLIDLTTVGHIYVSMYDVQGRVLLFRMNSLRLK